MNNKQKNYDMKPQDYIGKKATYFEYGTQITEDALNHYWHYVMDMLAKNSLGNIQRANLELDKKRLNELLERFRQPCT